MSNLIKNELIKIFKKKSTYIILAITIVFIIASNFIYKNNESQYFYSYSDDLLEFYEESLDDFSPTDLSTQSAYIDTKTQIDMIKLIKKYGYSSWQANIIPQELYTYIRDINEYTYFNIKDEDTYNESKLKYDEIVKKLDADDWRYFATIQLNDVNNQIAIQKELQQNSVDKSELKSIESTLNSLEAQKQVLQWRLDKDISFAPSFLNSCLERYENFNELVYQYEHSSDNHSYSEKQDYYEALENLNVNKYYIENNIRDIKNNDTRGLLINLFNEYELFILIFVIMIAGGIVSDEFNKGTIKLLLVRPYSRVKILLSKFIVCVIVLLLFIISVAGIQFIVGGIIQGFDSLKVPAVVYNYNTHQIETLNIIKFIIISTIAKLPMYILLMTLAFACSTIFTNTAVSIVLPLLGYMGSSLINMLAMAYDIKALLYFVTPNWDLTDYLFGGLPMFEGLTVPFSLVVCLVYFLIMIIVSFTIFKKRNIKNI